MTTSRDNRRVIRIILTDPCKVVIGSIGNNIRYEMITQNISSTGFFLKFDKPGRFPFGVSSIMEVWLELEPGNTIFFNGKLARKVNKGDPSEAETGTGIGIRIVQISKDHEDSLRKFIEKRASEEESENLEQTS